MRLFINHVTHYHYDAPVKYALQQLRLTPKSRAGQRVLNWQTTVDGGRQELQFEDQHHNLVTLISFDAGRQKVSISCEGEVETTDQSGIVGVHGGYAPMWYFNRETSLTRPGPLVRKLVDGLDDEFDDDVTRMHSLSARIAASIAYETGKTDALTSAEDALATGSGVCQDHAHVFVSAARLMGFPARYVSGYLMLNERVNQDASHAWAEAHVDGIGWIGFDPSNGISPDERYVRVATGLDYNEAAPISGMRFGDGGESMTVSVQVQQ
jgi:transglutaminase-like putative cysteine protease